MNNPRTLALLFFLVSTTSSCGNGATNTAVEFEQKSTSQAIKYSWSEVTKEIPSDAAPLGHWELRIKIPQFSSSDPSLKLTAINERLQQLVDEHQCPDNGDQVFTAEVHSATKSLISLSFEAMWYCENMAGPDSVAEILNFSPETAQEIDLTAQLIPEQIPSLRQMIASEMDGLEKSDSGDQSCSPRDFHAIYKVKDGVAFAKLPSTHGDSGCDVVLPLEKITSLFLPNSVFAQPEKAVD